jgi:hypothetical protein
MDGETRLLVFPWNSASRSPGSALALCVHLASGVKDTSASAFGVPSRTQIHLLLIPPSPLPRPHARRAAERRGPDALIVPPGVSHLLTPQGGSPSIAVETPAAAARALTLERLDVNRQPRLAVLNTGAARVIVNGQIAPPIVFLGDHDQLLVGDDCLFHVAVFRKERVGLPSPELVAAQQNCLLCLHPLAGSSEVYTCDCGRAMHRQCVREGSSCPACPSVVSFAAGYRSLPEEVLA